MYAEFQCIMATRCGKMYFYDETAFIVVSTGTKTILNFYNKEIN